MIAKALEQLPNLQEVYVRSGDRWIGAKELSDRFGSPEKIFVSVDGTYSHMEAALCISARKPANFSVLPIAPDQTPFSKRSHRPLIHLNAPGFLRLGPSPVLLHLDLHRNLLPFLSTLQLGCELDHKTGIGDRFPEHCLSVYTHDEAMFTLGRALRSAEDHCGLPRLKHLTIIHRLTIPTYTSVFPSSSMPNLETLKLCRLCFAWFEGFILFLAERAATLIRVHLVDCKVTESPYDMWFNHGPLTTAEFVKLKSFSVDRYRSELRRGDLTRAFQGKEKLDPHDVYDFLS